MMFMLNSNSIRVAHLQKLANKSVLNGALLMARKTFVV